MIPAAGGTYDLAGPAGRFSFSTRPVQAGEVLELFGVGFGPTERAVPAGQAFSGATPVANLVKVTIGGIACTVQFAGLISAGLYQLNIIVPSGTGSGDQLLQATVRNPLAGDVLTQDGIYLTVK